MLGAIYVGLSGLNAFSEGLQTISNNVANLNTLGYKGTTVTFTDLFSHGGDGLSYSGNGGSNSSGDGVRIASPIVDFSQGDLRASANDLDLAIKGSGFLVLLNGDNTYYTRTGQFVVDKDGYIAQQGTQDRLGVLDGSGKVVALNIDGKRTSQPAITTKVTFADNLSSSATSASVSDVAVYDSRGGKQVWGITFTKSTDATTPNQWSVSVKNASGTEIGTGTLKFIGSVVDPSTSEISVTTSPDGADPFTVKLDFSSGVTSFSGGTVSTLRAAKVDGHAVGNLSTVTVNAEGKIELKYSNEQIEKLGAVAIADFRDPQELVRAGEGKYENRGKGEMRVLASGTDGVGKIVAKQVETSNTNLSAEFGNLILIQRGYQASSQVVSVANDMIQQLFGIRGQG